ncbi:hypothetical protein CHU98_g12140 [Xylaria longipes]|nr:hypothetical protein CHU98_g12140 [Xylaria longipes]
MEFCYGVDEDHNQLCAKGSRTLWYVAVIVFSQSTDNGRVSVATITPRPTLIRSLDSDALYCQMPQTLGLLDNPLDWDGFFDFKESVRPISVPSVKAVLLGTILTTELQIDPKSSLELLQEPLPCTYEPHDEWLVEFKRLQDVHDRARAVSVPTIPAPFQEQNEIRQSYPSQPEYHSRDKFSKNSRPARIRDETGCTTPTPTRYSRSTEGRSPALYDWNPTPAYDYQQTLGDHDVQSAMKGLREIEQNLKAETKRRMSQIEQSRPRSEQGALHR